MSLGKILQGLLNKTQGDIVSKTSLVGNFFGAQKPSPAEVIRLTEEERKKRALSFFGADDYGYPYPGDDAPNILVPEPLVQSPTTFVPQSTEVPQIIEAPRGQVVKGLANIILEIERINRNITNIQTALANSSAIEAKYREQIIKDKQGQIAERDKLRSQRRANRRRESVFSRMMSPVREAMSPVAAGGKSLITGLLQSTLMAFAGGIVNAFKQAKKPPINTDPIDPTKYSGDIFKDTEFIDEVNKIAKNLGMSPLDLLAVMDFETGGTFSPSIQNPKSLATGLLQFTPGTAKGLGTTTDDLKGMSRLEQLKYVEKYLKSKGLQGQSLDDVYMSVLLPAAQGAEDDDVLFTKDGGGIFGQYESPAVAKKGYEQNKSLDANNDGQITKAEAAAPVLQRRQSKYPDLQSPPPDPAGPQSSAPGTPLSSDIAAAPVKSSVSSGSRPALDLGPVARAPIVIDARVEKKLNAPQMQSGVPITDDVASIEPRLTNSGYENMFAV